jgi:hypothetical protein
MKKILLSVLFCLVSILQLYAYDHTCSFTESNGLRTQRFSIVDTK